jgi:predicted peptidase
MKTFFLYIICLLFFQKNTYCQPAKVVEHISTKTKYHYLIYEPENYLADTAKRWPLIVFLHGRSLSGKDLKKVRTYGLINEVDRGKSYPSIIIAPQVNKGQSWNPDLVIECIEHIKSTHRIDSLNISLTGMSLGGYGVLHTAGKYPEKFCAVAAFCGGGKISDASNLSQIPIWIAHGRLDKAVPFSESEKLVKEIKKINESNLVFTIFDNYGHGELARLFSKKELIDFLLNNKKGSASFFPKLKLDKLK